MPRKPKATPAPARTPKNRPAAESVAKALPNGKRSEAREGAASRSKAARKSASALDPVRLDAIFSRFREKEPEPKGELEHVNPFTLLVAVVLSAQATDAGVNKATRALFKVADTPERMVALGEEKLRDYIKTIGLYRNKAKNVILLSQRLIEEHDSKVPADRDALTALPGVGRKTANVVLNMAFGQKTMAVDTHVFRVSHRLGLSDGKTPDAVELDLMGRVPDEYLYHAHHWLILHGRYTCLARKPRCGLCPIAALCTSADKIDDA